MHPTEYLDRLLSEGSTWIEQKKLKRIPADALQILVKKGEIMKAANPKGSSGVYYTLPSYNMWETYVAYDLIRILYSYCQDFSDKEIAIWIQKAEKETGKHLHEEQVKAVYAAVKNGVCVITGGPGTGKTCVIETVLYVLRHLQFGVDIRLTAPTGKAARRMTESTGYPAKTAQKELGITYANPSKKMFGGDVLIIDEISMLDIETAYYIFRAIENGKKVLLVGDINQLPSVGPGAVLKDIIESKCIPTVKLKKTFRQANDSNLFANILKIQDGQADFNSGDDFEINNVSESESEDRQIDTIVKLFLREYRTHGVENVACLLPYRKAGKLCSDNINNILQAEVNPIGNRPYLLSKTEKGLNVKFSEGDPVMQLQNREECANGDVGMIKRVSGNKIYVSYSDVIVEYPDDTLEQLSLAYSMSINKSQGSEYKSVIMALTQAHSAMFSRNMVYTGVTRAKEKVTLLQDEAAMMASMKIQIEYTRYTLLADKIKMYDKKWRMEHLFSA